jgi:hypothetical protein
MVALPEIKFDDFKSARSSSDHKEEISETATHNIKCDILVTPNAQVEVKRAVRRIDLAIMPIMTMFYLLSFLVRLLQRHCKLIIRLHLPVRMQIGSCQHRCVQSSFHFSEDLHTS